MSWVHVGPPCGGAAPISRSNHTVKHPPARAGRTTQEVEEAKQIRVKAAWCFDVKAHHHSKPGAWSYPVLPYQFGCCGEGSQAWLWRMMIGEILDDRLGA